MRLILVCLLLSFNSFAMEWRELESGQTYTLTQSFQLPQTERGGSLLDFSSGEKVALKEILPLSGISVMVYIFDYQKCPGETMETTMEIIPVQETAPVVEIGAQLEKNCELNIYIEVKDILTSSFFE